MGIWNKKFWNIKNFQGDVQRPPPPCMQGSINHICGEAVESLGSAVLFKEVPLSNWFCIRSQLQNSPEPIF